MAGDRARCPDTEGSHTKKTSSQPFIDLQTVGERKHGADNEGKHLSGFLNAAVLFPTPPSSRE